MEEKLTYVNTHAKLMTRESSDILAQVEATQKSAGANKAAHDALKIAQAKCAERLNNNNAVPHREVRLDSFVSYLLKNKCGEGLVRQALCEQFCLPGLGNQSAAATAVTQAVEVLLKQGSPLANGPLQAWHQAYHLFRMSASCFVKGADAFFRDRFEEALDLFTTTYNVSVKIHERPPAVSFFLQFFLFRACRLPNGKRGKFQKLIKLIFRARSRC